MRVFKLVINAEQHHCCKGLTCLQASRLHSPFSLWLCQASSVTRSNRHTLHSAMHPLPPSFVPGMAQTFLQLHGELDSPSKKTTGKTKPAKTASSGGNIGSGVPCLVQKPQFPSLCHNSLARLPKSGTKFTYRFSKMCYHHMLRQYL